MKKTISILGSTGSIGTQALEVIEKLPESFKILALAAGNNVELIKSQIIKYNPEIVSVKNERHIKELKSTFKNTTFLHGEEGLLEICSDKRNDIILMAVNGIVGLKPTITAINNGIDIALANKETLVAAGNIVMPLARDKSVNILPVDSEHSAIFQCTDNFNYVKKLTLTASGGPFRNKALQDIENANVSEALCHPKWRMGSKITIDSATMMNKGLEVIEAHWLFNKQYKDIDIVIHPQSIIHSAVEFLDGSVVAQLGFPSMHIPIQYALTYPERIEGIKTSTFDFVKAGNLTFENVDYNKFPCLKLAYEAGKKEGTYPVVLNAVNEKAVESFLKGEIKLTDIAKIVEKALESHSCIQNPTFEEILILDKEIRLSFVK